MEIMVYPLLWVVQDLYLYHQPHLSVGIAWTMSAPYAAGPNAPSTAIARQCAVVLPSPPASDAVITHRYPH